jgi:hypothetical protein
MTDSSDNEDVLEFESDEEIERKPKVNIPQQQETEQEKIDRRKETSKLNLAKARARKAELAQLRKLEKAKSVITEHIIEEEDSESSSDESDEEELVLSKRGKKPSKKAVKGLVKQVTKMTKTAEKKKAKKKQDDDRIARLEQLLANQLTEAKRQVKKTVRKPKTKTTVVKVEQLQPEPKTNDKLRKYAQTTLLDLGL